jgi:hypothetical protein
MRPVELVHRKRVAVMAACALLLISVGVVAAQSSSSQSWIYACVNNSSGTIHVVMPPNVTCGTNEIPPTWVSATAVQDVRVMNTTASLFPLLGASPSRTPVRVPSL